jgi:hypothetical protein
MALDKGKHIVEELNSVRCTLIEKDVDANRADFLKNLLLFNGYEVQVAGTDGKFAVGVTDLVFNPLIAVYQQKLKTPDGKRVSPAYWRQYTTQASSLYWEFKR